jgi:EthD domain
MSATEFSQYYEERHAQSNQRLRPASADYRRNYPDLGDPWTQRDKLSELGGFDVMTENWYSSRAAFENVLSVMTRSSVSATIMEDEARFEIRERKKVFAVEETPTLDYESGAHEAWAQRNEAGGFKIVRYVTAPFGMPSKEFRSHYEEWVATGSAEIFSRAFDRRRNYLLFDDPLTFNGPQERPSAITHGSFGCDLIEEFWYPDRKAATPDIEQYASIAGHTASSEGIRPRAFLVIVREHRMARPARPAFANAIA